MADFDIAHIKTMGNEGGYANNPADAGGEAYKGISRKYWAQWRGWAIIDRVKAALLKPPVYDSTEYRHWVEYCNSLLAKKTGLQELVFSFYRVTFWDSQRLGEIADQMLANWAYDHHVNAGGRGIKWLQEAAGVTADGHIGVKSLAAINAIIPAVLLAHAEDVAAFYRLDRAEADPSQLQFLPSWLRRDGVSDDEIKQVIQVAKDGLTYAEVATLKQMIEARA